MTQLSEIAMKNTIEAAYHTEFDELLERLGLLEAFRDGELRCAFCDSGLDSRNIFGVFSEESQIRVSCDKSLCAGRLVGKSLKVMD